MGLLEREEGRHRAVEWMVDIGENQATGGRGSGEDSSGRRWFDGGWERKGVGHVMKLGQGSGMAWSRVADGGQRRSDKGMTERGGFGGGGPTEEMEEMRGFWPGGRAVRWWVASVSSTVKMGKKVAVQRKVVGEGVPRGVLLEKMMARGVLAFVGFGRGVAAEVLTDGCVVSRDGG